MLFEPNRPRRQGAPVYKRRLVAPANRNPDEVRTGEVCLPERTMRELLLAAKEACLVLGELGGAVGIRRLDNPHVRRIAAAIHFAEKACRKRANEMSKEAPK